MFCQKCGAEVMPGGVFCTKCGNKVPILSDIDPSTIEAKDPLTDAIRKFQKGDTPAFDTIYNESKRYIYYTIIKTVGDKEIADDILQETYLEVYKSLGQLHAPGAFKGWAAKIAQHKISRYFQKKNPELFSTEEEMDDTVGDLVEDDTSALPEDAMINKEVQRLISEIIDKLPQNQKSVVISYYYNQMTIPEIAQSMGIPENTVKTCLFRGKKRIKDGVLEIEQKHGTKLYALPLAGLVGLLFTEEAKAAVVTTTASQILSTVAAGSATVSGIAVGNTVVASNMAGSSITSAVSDITTASAVSNGAVSISRGTATSVVSNNTVSSSVISNSVSAGTTSIAGNVSGSMAASSTAANMYSSTQKSAKTISQTAFNSSKTENIVRTASKATNITGKTVKSSIRTMIICSVVGLAVGSAATAVVTQYVYQQRQEYTLYEEINEVNTYSDDTLTKSKDSPFVGIWGYEKDGDFIRVMFTNDNEFRWKTSLWDVEVVTGKWRTEETDIVASFVNLQSEMKQIHFSYDADDDTIIMNMEKYGRAKLNRMEKY